MKLFEIYRPLTEAIAVRKYQHLEELVFTEGASGAQRAVEYLEGLLQGDTQISIKWDGNPTAYFGRNENGEFTFVGNNAWQRAQYFADKQSMGEFIRTSGKGEDWRSEFANSMMQLWDIFEAATPQDFRGYLYCDLLFSPSKPVKMIDGRLTFKPNEVTYRVDPASEIGKRIAAASAGAAVHLHFPEYAGKQPRPVDNLDQFSDPNLFLVSQEYVPNKVDLDSSQIDDIKTIIQKHGAAVDQFLSPVPGMKYVGETFRTALNKVPKERDPAGLRNRILEWIQSGGMVSEGKQKKIQLKMEQNPQGARAMFDLVEKIMAAKNSVIDQLDKVKIDVLATTGDQPGGEGYMSSVDHGIKFVPRHRWTPRR